MVFLAAAWEMCILTVPHHNSRAAEVGGACGLFPHQIVLIAGISPLSEPRAFCICCLSPMFGHPSAQMTGELTADVQSINSYCCSSLLLCSGELNVALRLVLVLRLLHFKIHQWMKNASLNKNTWKSLPGKMLPAFMIDASRSTRFPNFHINNKICQYMWRQRLVPFLHSHFEITSLWFVL